MRSAAELGGDYEDKPLAQHGTHVCGIYVMISLDPCVLYRLHWKWAGARSQCPQTSS
jgi:hypothetical protein